MVYREGLGFVYEEDFAAVKEAQDEVASLENEAAIDALESRRKRLRRNATPSGRLRQPHRGAGRLRRSMG
jgi:hypothetical protein